MNINYGNATESSVSLTDAHAVFRRWLGDDYDTDALDAVLATAAVESLDGDPLWLLLISGSGNAKTETVQALDGYAVDVPYAEMIDKGAVLALSRDGKALGIGSFGPAQIVFPRGERADLAEMPDDWWVWQIYHISVK